VIFDNGYHLQKKLEIHIKKIIIGACKYHYQN